MTGVFPTHIKTDRLRFSAAGPDAVDLNRFYRICSADDGIDAVTDYVTWDPHAHPKETADFLSHTADQFAAGEAAHYILRTAPSEEGSDEIAGMTALVVDWDRRCGQPGIWLRRRFWGRGYAGERAAALGVLAFEHLDLDCLSIEVRRENERSYAAVDRYVGRFGGQYEGLLRYADDWDGTPVDLHRWTILAGEFEVPDDGTSISFDWADH